jgi:hypothetical protein
LNFSTEQLAPRAPQNPAFLEDLERTMALLVFPANSLEPHLAEILNPDLRRTVADRVNKAILTSQNQRRDAAIRNLVRLRSWAENTARESKKEIPARLELGLTSPTHDNGNDQMVV